MSPWIRLLRPKQWIKNAFVLAPLFFAQRLGEPTSWLTALEATALFFCIACAVYIVNDLHDRHEDRQHPAKKNRPLAAGEIAPASAHFLSYIFIALACVLAWGLPAACAAIAGIYLALNGVYTFVLKRIAIVDIFFIASCYVLRVLMGCYALQVTVSPWIILTTFLLALFLGFGKRYHEMGFTDYALLKPNLRHYSRELLDRLVTVSGGGALIAYAIYAAEIAEKTGKVEMVYTVAFVAFGLFRYLQSIHVYGQGGEPETIILRDRAQLVNLALWLAATMMVLG